ncbi:hypothetical protein NNC19_07175 [Clostridium sp. SHJSY1]|uniref:hypothetical protein n=1 Tax=Clostridium sp. SHJSY1 TaxID=2942483 RepID=UPI002876ECCD|nr:hypothetical protein [Clostridium sp. SHJSY1]MDS0525455.1 hypothetical protein [Clostridium sp. SHJSY1]
MSDVFTLSADVSVKIGEAINNLNKLSSEARQIGSNLQDAEGKSGNFSNKLKEVQNQGSATGKVLEETGNKGSSFGNKLGNVVKSIAGFVGTTQIISFGKACVSAATGAATANTKLETVLKAASHATDEQVTSLKNYASELSKTGVISGGLNKAAMTQLSTFGLQTDSIKKLIPQLDNLAVNQKGVNATSEDMMGYANMVGKAMQGSATAMTRVGVTMTDAQKKIIETGTEEQKAATITEVLKQNYGNLNEEIAKTPEGKAKILSNNLGALKSQIGTMLLPVVTSLTNGLQKVVDWFNKLPAGAQQFILGAVAVIGTMGLITSAIGSITGALKILGITVKFAGAPWLVLGAGIVAALVLAYNKCEWFRNGVNAIGDWLKNFFTVTLPAAFNVVVDFFKNNWQDILLVLVNPFAGGFKILYEHCDAFKSKVDGVVQFIKDVWNDIEYVLEHPFQAAVDEINRQIDKLRGYLKFEWNLPNIKLPHFSIDGSFSLNPPSIPHIGVDWYSSGAIFTQPTVLGNIGLGDANNGRGSNAEAILPLDKLWAEMRGVANRPVEVIITVDGREFTRQVVAPNQDQLEGYNIGR